MSFEKELNDKADPEGEDYFKVYPQDQELYEFKP